MTTTEQLDAITEDSLRAIGGMKWSAYPEATGAFVAEMDFGAAPAITKAIESTVTQGLFGYLPIPLGEAMSAACANWQKATYDWEVDAGSVRPLPDVLKGLEMAIEHFCAPGAAVVLPTPAYMPFFKVPTSMGREIIQVPMLRDGSAWKLDLDGIDAALAGDGGLLIFCNPHNPIGKVYSREEMLEVASIVDKHAARVFSDEIHAPLVFSGNRHVPYASVSAMAASHTITATSASKAWNLPGLKCAQLILSNDADIKTWDEVGVMAEHGASNVGVVANTAAYTAGSQWLSDVLTYLDGSRALMSDLVAEHLPAVSYEPPEGTYLAWLDCRELDLGDHPSEFFLENANVACTDGALCGDVGAGHIRFNLATPRPILQGAVARMGQVLKGR